MAFFGLTFLGYQDPFRERRLELPKYEVPEGIRSTMSRAEIQRVNHAERARAHLGVGVHVVAFGNDPKPLHGLQQPVGTPSPKLELFYPKLPPIGPAGYDGTMHQGSYDRYREAVKRVQLQKYPNQLYRVPLTCGQDIGWWLRKDPSVGPEAAVSWMRVQRHPQLRSPMTKFVENMTTSNPLFSMF